MPEICFYEPWTYQLSLPEKIEAYERQKKRAEEYKGGNSKRTLQKYLREYMKTLLLVPRERQD